MKHEIKLGQRAATVTSVGRKTPKEGEGEETGIAIEIDLDTHVDKDELAQFLTVTEGEPLEVIEALFDSHTNARVLNLKALGLKDIPNASVSIEIGEDTLSCVGNLRRIRLSLGDSLRGAKMHFQCTCTPDANDEHQASLLLHMPNDVKISIGPGPQKEMDLQPARGRGRGKGANQEAHTH